MVQTVTVGRTILRNALLCVLAYRRLEMLAGLPYMLYGIHVRAHCAVCAFVHACMHAMCGSSSLDSDEKILNKVR